MCTAEPQGSTYQSAQGEKEEQMSSNQFNLSSARLIQLLICQQRSDVSHTLSVWLNNIWAGRLSAVWRVLVMDGSLTPAFQYEKHQLWERPAVRLLPVVFSEWIESRPSTRVSSVAQRREPQTGEDDWAGSALRLISGWALSTTEVLPFKSLCDFWLFYGDGSLVTQSKAILWGILWV